MPETELIDEVYKVFLGRLPDPDGQRFYANLLRNGASRIEIIDRVIRSKERKIGNNCSNYSHASLNPLILIFRCYHLLAISPFGKIYNLFSPRAIQLAQQAHMHSIIEKISIEQKLFASELLMHVKHLKSNSDQLGHDRTGGYTGNVRSERTAEHGSPIERRIQIAEPSGSNSPSVPFGLGAISDSNPVSNASPLAVMQLEASAADAMRDLQSVDYSATLAHLCLSKKLKLPPNPASTEADHHRQPYRELTAGQVLEQYFLSSQNSLRSLTVYFYTYCQPNSATVRVSLFKVSDNLAESKVGEIVLSEKAIQDGLATNIWLQKPLENSLGVLFRLEISIQELPEGALLTVALSPSGPGALLSDSYIEGQSLCLALRLNAAPAVDSNKFFALISGCPGDAFRYRCTHLAEALEQLGYSCDVYEPHTEPLPLLVKNYKTIILHRVPYSESIENLLRVARERSIFTIFDTDDLVFAPNRIDEIDAVKRMSKEERAVYLDGVIRYQKTLRACDAVTVSTEKLRQEIIEKNYHSTVIVVRNRVSSEMQLLAQKALTKEVEARDSNIVRIAYFSGSKTHEADFAECSDALVEILERRPNVYLTLVGHINVPKAFDTVQRQLEVLPFVSWRSLPSIYKTIDINLAPLESNSAFTEAKSELKYLEAALLGIPTVASRVGAYARTVSNGRTGFLCTTKAEWLAHLGALIDSPDLRAKIGAAAKQDVLDRSTTDANLTPLGASYRNLIHSSKGNLFPRPRVAIITRAPIANTGGGYKKIFIIANYLRSDFDVTVYVEPIAHLARMSESDIRTYCSLHFSFPPESIAVGHDSIEPCDIAIATNWPTAPVVARLHNARVRAYFVQDFEPEFYEASDQNYLAAASTYDLPLYFITIGDYLKFRLASPRVSPVSVPFAIDRAFVDSIPSQQNGPHAAPRKIAFFARPNIPRRMYSTGVAALNLVKQAYPGVEIIFYGSSFLPDISFEHTNVGEMAQAELANILCDVDIHLSYSMTNVSTVLFEAMACGCACVEADVESVRSMIRDRQDCLLAEPTAESTAAAIINLLANRELREKIASSGTSVAKGMTENAMCRTFAGHLRWCLGASASPQREGQVNL